MSEKSRDDQAQPKGYDIDKTRGRLPERELAALDQLVTRHEERLCKLEQRVRPLEDWQHEKGWFIQDLHQRVKALEEQQDIVEQLVESNRRIVQVLQDGVDRREAELDAGREEAQG